MSLYDHFSGIAVFVRVVETGSFAAAASRLNLSRSAVGKTVSRLEEKLGVKLIHRTTRSQSLTEDGQLFYERNWPSSVRLCERDGQLFYERCLRAVNEIREGAAMLDSGRQLVQGKLRVSVPVLFGSRCVAPILVGIAHNNPGLELEMDFDDRRVDVVKEGFDFVVRAAPLLSEAERNLVARRMAEQRMAVCASPAYLQAHGTPRELDDLAAHQCIVYYRSGQHWEWRFAGRHGTPVTLQPPSRLLLDNYEAIADAAVAGFGLAWLPYWLVRDRVKAGTLVQVLADQSSQAVEYYALWPKAKHLPLRTRTALDELARQLPHMM